MAHVRRAMLACIMAGLAILAGSSQAKAAAISNDCSAGYVTFTFDDGPGVDTPRLVQTLQDLNLRGVFFVLGNKVTASGIAPALAAGFPIGNHTWDHSSFTGASTPPSGQMTEQQITDELTRTNQAIVAAGGPMPTLYRPPYGDINAWSDLVAQHVGLRIVMPWGANIVDSQDWTGISGTQIAQNVTQGYTINGVFKPGIKADSIIAMHDGDAPESGNTIDSLPIIADYMNSHHLCSTSTVRLDATGGVVPAPAPPEPLSGNLVQNAGLETLRPGSSHSGNSFTNPAAEPLCFQQGGSNVASNVASWALTSDAHSGTVAENVNVTSWNQGDRKIVLTQRQSEASCLAAVSPGQTYSFWVWYKGNWPFAGSGASKVSIATYYRNSSGAWVYWQGSPLFAPTTSWNLAYFSSAPLPAGATAVSFGLALSGVGTLTTDDYAEAQN